MLFLVQCFSGSKKIESRSFSDYDTALDYALKKNSIDFYECLVFELDSVNHKWIKRLILYAPECC